MEIPKVKGHWLWGSAKAFQRDPYGFPGRVAREKGGIAKFRVFHRRVISINNPELFHHIMVKNHLAYGRGLHYRNQHVLFGRGMISTEGDEWHKKRVRGAPAFHQNEIKKMVPLSVAATDRSFEDWFKAAHSGTKISLVPAMLKLTISVICQSLFSVDIDHENSVQFSLTIRDSMGIIRKRNNSFLRLPLWVPTKTHAELLRTKEAMTHFVLGKIASRKKVKESGTETNDILNVLLQSKDPDVLAQAVPKEFQELVDECKTLLVAGFETTAYSLTWALYLLATHPEVAKKWRQECEEVLGDANPTWDVLEKLVYTRQIILEAMRLYPVVYTLPRECLQDDILGGHRIRKGDLLLLSIYGMHRSPEHWQNPNEFNPDRFAAGKDWPRKCYAPFGKGKHTCLGNNFALSEMLIILSLIGRRFSIERADDAKIGVKCTFVMMPDQDIYVSVRQQNADQSSVRK